MDVGLVNSLCGLKLLNPEALITIHEGGLAEQFIGQEFLNLEPFFEDTRLYFWNREEKNSNAEIDYLLSHQNSVIPVEVKAGKTGSLKSLHMHILPNTTVHQSLSECLAPCYLFIRLTIVFSFFRSTLNW